MCAKGRKSRVPFCGSSHSAFKYWQAPPAVPAANMSDYFRALTDMRQSRSVNQLVVDGAKSHCVGGTRIADLQTLWPWMTAAFPLTPFFDASLSSGNYPKNLAAFVVACEWPEWQKHAVWLLHGEMCLSRLRFAKDCMTEDMFKDNVAGALMHRANGLMHTARCALDAGLQEKVRLPCWDEPRSLEDLALLAVSDMRQSCSLRSAKYGTPNGSQSIVKAYQAALRNLADAICIYSRISGTEAKMVDWLRERADTLALTCNSKLLDVCESGEKLSSDEQRLVQRDLRLAETAAGNLPVCGGGMTEDTCSRCRTRRADMLGFSCRCQCLCQTCATEASSRIQECPTCGDFTEFVAAPKVDASSMAEHKKEADPISKPCRFVACGLASHELGYPASLYQEPLSSQMAKGFVGKPHSGEEFEATAEGIAISVGSMKTCIACGCKSIGHGLAALANGGDKGVLQTMKERGIAFEVCPLSNMCVASTHYGNFTVPPIRVALDAGVPVVLGTDDANAWEPGAPGPSMREVIRYLVNEVGVTPKEMRGIAAESFRRAFIPENVCEEFLKRVVDVENIYEVPICDHHLHFVGSVPRSYLENVYTRFTYPGKVLGFAQMKARVPAIRYFNGWSCQNPWADLATFATETYAPTYGVLLSEGLSAVCDQILAIASSCSDHGVVAITMQIGVPQGATRPWQQFFMDQLALAQKRSLRLQPPCYVSFQADFIRNAPLPSAKAVEALMQLEGNSNTWLSDVLCDPEISASLKEKAIPDGLREHPARFPCTSNMCEILLIGNSYLTDNAVDEPTQLKQIREGLLGFAAEIKSVSFLPADSPFRVKADSLVFNSEQRFDAALTRTMDVISKNWGPCLKAAGL